MNLKFKNGSKVFVSKLDDEPIYQGLEFDNIVMDCPESKPSLWHRIKLCFLMRRLKKNGAWITWRFK